MNLLLSEELPLRTTRMLGDFAEDLVLPHRYGDLRRARFKLIRLSATRFFAADHPMPIYQVFVDEEKTVSWSFGYESDGLGNTWTVVTMAAPVPLEAVLSATGTGKRNPSTGALLENPAEIIEDIFRIAGRTEDWGQLRAEAASAALVIAGSVTEAKSIRGQIDEIMQSFAGIWTPTMCRLYPAATVKGPVFDLDMQAATLMADPSASLDDTADVLRLSYDLCDATGKALHYIELTANPQSYGGIRKEVVYPWLRTPANAEAVGRRVLERLAGERYLVDLSSNRVSLRPGDWIRLVDNTDWPFEGDDPVLMILSADITPDSNAVRLMAETVLTRPAIRVSAHSVALPDTISPSVTVEIAGNTVTLTVRDSSEKPVKDALVALNHGTAKKTDAQGRVQFVVTVHGVNYTLSISAPGKQPQELQVLL